MTDEVVPNLIAFSPPEGSPSAMPSLMQNCQQVLTS